jgi:hypothetical protein
MALVEKEKVFMNKQQYTEYEERVAFYLKGMKGVSTGPCSGCDICCKEYGLTEGGSEEVTVEPWFSWSPCEICNDPIGGNREYWHGIIANDRQIVHGSCCEDCIYYINFGRLDDTTMQEIDKG